MKIAESSRLEGSCDLCGQVTNGLRVVKFSDGATKALCLCRHCIIRLGAKDTTIRVSQATRDRLSRLASHGESLDAAINRILDELERWRGGY